MPTYLLTITYHDTTTHTVSGIRQGSDLERATHHYFMLAKKYYHEQLKGFSIVEVNGYAMGEKPASSRRKSGESHWGENRRNKDINS